MFVREIIVTMVIFYFWNHSTTEACSKMNNGTFVRCCNNYRLLSKKCVECPPGLFGLNCSASCPPNHYGLFCNTTCNCTKGFICEKTSGCINIALDEVSTIKSTQDSSSTLIKWYEVLGILAVACLITVTIIFGIVQCSKCVGRHRDLQQNVEDLIQALAPLTNTGNADRVFDLPGSASGGKSDSAIDENTLKDTSKRHSYNEYSTIKSVSFYQTLSLKRNPAPPPLPSISERRPLRDRISDDSSDDGSFSIPNLEVQTPSKLKESPVNGKVIFKPFTPNIDTCNVVKGIKKEKLPPLQNISTEHKKYDNNDVEYETPWQDHVFNVGHEENKKDGNRKESFEKPSKDQILSIDPEEVIQTHIHTTVFSNVENISKKDEVTNGSLIEKDGMLPKFETEEAFRENNLPINLDNDIGSSQTVDSSHSAELLIESHQEDYANLQLSEYDTTDQKDIIYMGLKNKQSKEHIYTVPHNTQDDSGETILTTRDIDYASVEKKIVPNAENILEKEKKDNSITVCSISRNNCCNEKNTEDADNIESKYDREIAELDEINQNSAIEKSDILEFSNNEDTLNESVCVTLPTHKSNADGEMLEMDVKGKISVEQTSNTLESTKSLTSMCNTLQKGINNDADEKHNDVMLSRLCNILQDEIPKTKYVESDSNINKEKTEIMHCTKTVNTVESPEGKHTMKAEIHDDRNNIQDKECSEMSNETLHYDTDTYVGPDMRHIENNECKLYQNNNEHIGASIISENDAQHQISENEENTDKSTTQLGDRHGLQRSKCKKNMKTEVFSQDDRPYSFAFSPNSNDNIIKPYTEKTSLQKSVYNYENAQLMSKNDLDHSQKSVKEKSKTLSGKRSKFVQFKDRIRGSLGKKSHTIGKSMSYDTTLPTTVVGSETTNTLVDITHTTPTTSIDMAHTSENRECRPYSFVNPT